VATARSEEGVRLFNRTWALLEKPDRTQDDDDEMVHCAHASAYYWRHVGTAANRARSEWQCSRVYAVLGRAQQALHHARRCLELVESNPDGSIEDWDEPAAREALARAHLAAGARDEAQRQAEEARRLAALIADAEDRTIIESDLASLP
jgi:tetratricopeptide (TPR) repeat protein